jgi:signal transduction histidine kinase/CheY-like chemotaxis protein
MLNRNEFNQATHAEGIRFIYSNLTSLVPSLSVLPTLLIWAMWDKIEHDKLLGWFFVALSVLAARLLLARLFFSSKPTDETIFKWGRWFTYTSLASGLVYGSSAILFFQTDSLAILLLVFTIIVGLANGATYITSHWLESYYAFVIPALGLAVYALFAQSDPGFNTLGIAFTAYLLMCLSIGYKSSRSVLTSIKLRFENDDLVKQLEVSKDKAEEANRRKTRFLASASHDLRQPVHALGLFSEALSHEKLSESGQHSLTFLKASISSLSELLNSLLDISRLDAGVIKPKFEPVDIAHLLERLFNDHQLQANEKGLLLKLKNNDCFALSDSTLLENILRNIITNSIKYTQQGKILIACRKKPNNQIWIDIWDTGVGIEADEQPHVFDEFYQIDNQHRDSQQGLGLGLAIVQRQVKLMGHQLSLYSKPQKGTLVRLKLTETSPPNTSLVANDAFTNTPEKLKHILIIDDNEQVLNGMQLTLQKWGYQTMAALNGNEAEKLCTTTLPDIIICDFRLSDNENGIKVIERIKTVFKKDIPSLLITGDTAPDRIQQAESSGLILLHKPVKPAKLRAALNLL